MTDTDARRSQDLTGASPTGASRTDAIPEIVMFFLGPDGQLVEDPPGAGAHTSLADVRRAVRAALDAERGHDPCGGLRRFGPRPVQGTGRVAKPGYRDEIVVTARANPGDAVEVAGGRGLFDPPLSRLRVDASSMTTRRFELTWDAVIDVAPWRHRRVRVRLYPSPSLNVTVLAMSPCRPRRVARRSFLRVGNRVMNELRERLDGRVAEGVDQR